jgi:hypothetical protein
VPASVSILPTPVTLSFSLNPLTQAYTHPKPARCHTVGFWLLLLLLLYILIQASQLTLGWSSTAANSYPLIFHPREKAPFRDTVVNSFSDLMSCTEMWAKNTVT